MILSWDIDRRLFELPLKGTIRGGLEERELLGNVVDTYAGGESIGAGCAGIIIRAGCVEGKKAKPGGFED